MAITELRVRDGMDAGQIIALGTVIVSVLIAYLQIQKNEKAALALQEEHLRNQLKLKLYEQFVTVFAKCTERLSAAQFAHNGPINALSMRVRHGFPAAPTETGAAISLVAHDGARAINEVLRVIEEYEIVFRRFRTIRRELAGGHRRFLDTQSRLWTKLLPYLPFVHLATGATVGAMGYPSESELDELESLQRAFQEVCSDLGAFLTDLQIEAQNELLGSLFARTLPPRNPLDPTMRVLSRDVDEPSARPPGSLV